ncbi:lebercilin [Betta splendens]|uniref:Lebercilin n=1 Tax=Betta splendens TaxID=158456 RepID=A0A6P7LQT2_BETSP|nr:lebercilin [Betta splendens]XP_040925429.1 lebercilin [Betta splendens]
MESELASDLYHDNRDVDLSRQSFRSSRKDSPVSSLRQHKTNHQDKNQDEVKKDNNVESRSKTRTRRSDPDRDHVSDGEGQQSSGSFYSEDYENDSPDRSLSPYSHSQTPSPTPLREARKKRSSSSSLYKTGGVSRRGMSRPQRPGGQRLTQQHRRGVQSQSKDSTPAKDLDLVTKRMLSVRLLKINELRNSLAELQQRTDELQKENRILRQLQVRQEKALQRYDDTESEISQLLSRHNNETHVLRERLRRSQERERAAERRLKDSEEQLQRSQATITRLKKLVDQRELGTRDELNRRLEEEKARAQEAEHKIKDLERGMELSNSSYQRQLAAEKKKTIGSQEEIRVLQEELERLANKLKEKERELDTKNIYANRIVKGSQRKDTDSYTKRKVSSRNSTKAVQTEDRTSSLDFPTPPPAITDANEYSEQPSDEYLSLKELNKGDMKAETEDRRQNWEPQKIREREKRDREIEVVKENKFDKDEKLHLNVLEEKPKRLGDGWEKEMGEEYKRKTSYLIKQKDEENKKKHNRVQEEVERWNQEALTNQQAAEEARRKKEKMLAKMLEIDRQNQGVQDSTHAESAPPEAIRSTGDRFSPRPPEQRHHNSPIFNLTESGESDALRNGAGSREGGRRRPEGGAITTMGRRLLRTQTSSDDLAFGSYAPSFGNPASRGSSGFPPTPPKENKESALEAIGVLSLRGMEAEVEKEAEKGGSDRKTNLMQQLFGALAKPASDSMNPSSKMEVLSSPPTTNGLRSRRDGLFDLNSGSSTPPASSLSTLHVADSRPAVRAIASFDDDIEELTL